METIGDVVLRKLTAENLAALGLLLSSSVIAALVMYVRSSGSASLRGFVSFAFPREILYHRSARADFLFWITRKMVMPIVLLPAVLAVVITVGYGVHLALNSLFGPDLHGSGDASWETLFFFTVSMLLAYDLSYYIYHYAQHRFPVLWELHKVHHSAEVMVGITKDRVHPLDDIMNRVWDGFTVGTVYGVWLFFALDPVEVTIFGINVYVMRNILMMDFVRHTHLKVSFGRLGNAIVLCPHYHQLHHSMAPEHHDKNFGLMLPIWDRLFGTLVIPKPGESFNFGLSDGASHEYQSLAGLYLLPLRRMAARIWPRRNAAMRLPVSGAP